VVIKTLLIANRGDVVRRIAVSASALGMVCVALDEPGSLDSTLVPPSSLQRIPLSSSISLATYLDMDMWLALAKKVKADALHPGWGFLAENADFAQAVMDAGLIWVGPCVKSMTLMANKFSAKQLAAQVGVPVILGSETSYDLADDSQEQALVSAADDLGYPLVIKSLASGGGRGMKVVERPEDLMVKARSCHREGRDFFGDGRILLEKYIKPSRHIEVQVLCDHHGGCKVFATREGTLQRRFQKILEESPAPFISSQLQEALFASAASIARGCHYRGAGTVEFLVYSQDKYAFLEMNTRLQVEHPLTEELYRTDLVEWQLRIAYSEKLSHELLASEPSGHAIEARLCAEDPHQDFLPQSGDVSLFYVQNPSSLTHRGHIRLDSALSLQANSHISARFDSLYAKVISYAPLRKQAAGQLAAYLGRCVFIGPKDNKSFLCHVLQSPSYLDTSQDSDYIKVHHQTFLENLRDHQHRVDNKAEYLFSSKQHRFCGLLDAPIFYKPQKGVTSYGSNRTHLVSKTQKIAEIFQKGSSDESLLHKSFLESFLGKWRAQYQYVHEHNDYIKQETLKKTHSSASNLGQNVKKSLHVKIAEFEGLAEEKTSGWWLMEFECEQTGISRYVLQDRYSGSYAKIFWDQSQSKSQALGCNNDHDKDHQRAIFHTGDVMEVEVEVEESSHKNQHFCNLAGKVTEVGVKVGSEVKKGDFVCVLESMKMEIPVVSALKGVVKWVVSEGQYMSQNDLLMEVACDAVDKKNSV